MAKNGVVDEQEVEEVEAEEAEEVEDPSAVLAANRKLSRENKNLRSRLKALEEKLDTVAQSSMSDQERAVAEAVAAAKDDVESRYRRRLVESMVREAAADVLRDPEDAIVLLDLEGLDPDDDDDLKAVGDMLGRLVKSKPYLAKRSSAPDIEQGPQGGSTSAATQGGDWLRSIQR